MLSVCAIAACAALSATTARGGEPKDAKQGTKTAQATKDPNYRWYNGQWWYWIAKDKNWLVWNGSQWTKFDAAQANRGVRSFSYQEEATENPAYYAPYGNAPYTVSNNDRIIPSYGFRSAGSKVLGNY
jgi:hypothetical protein